MAVGTNDAPINRANGAYMKTNSADTRAERPNSDDSIGSFMVSSPCAIQILEGGWTAFRKILEECSPSKTTPSQPDILSDRTVRHIAMQDRYEEGPPSSGASYHLLQLSVLQASLFWASAIAAVTAVGTAARTTAGRVGTPSIGATPAAPAPAPAPITAAAVATSATHSPNVLVSVFVAESPESEPVLQPQPPQSLHPQPQLPQPQPPQSPQPPHPHPHP